jgi:hypothetical protein
MRLALPEALHPPVTFGAELSPISRRSTHRAGPEATSSTSRAGPGNEEVADPSFWTPYDYFMLEREARAVRRAFIFSIVAGWMRKLSGETPARSA